MSSEAFGQKYADIYDLFYQDKDYQSETDFIEKKVRTLTNEKFPMVLELACGTGRHLCALAQRRFQMTGLDQSRGMLDQLEKRMKTFNIQASLHCQDMTFFSIPGERFHAVLCLFDALGYVCTNQAIRSTLVRIREHLLPGGVLIFDFWHSAAMLRNYDPCRLRQVNDGGRLIRRISETTLDPIGQIGTVKYTFVADTPGGATIWEESHRNRYFGVAEMDLFLEVAGFSKRDYYPGFTEAGVITDNDFHVVAVATL